MAEALPNASRATRTRAGELITTTLGAVGKEFSETPRTSREIKAYADAMADMFGAIYAVSDPLATFPFAHRSLATIRSPVPA